MFFFGGAARSRTGLNGFAIRCITALLSRQVGDGWAVFSAKKKGSRSFPVLEIWSGIRGSNSRPIPWQGIALPTELIPHVFHKPLSTKAYWGPIASSLAFYDSPARLCKPHFRRLVGQGIGRADRGCSFGFGRSFLGRNLFIGQRLGHSLQRDLEHLVDPPHRSDL